MANPQDVFRVLPISSNEALLEQIRSALGKEEGYLLISAPAMNDELMEAVEKLKPNCILLDYLTAVANPLELIDGITVQFPETLVVALLTENETADANRVMLAGARAFINQPVIHKQLLDTLARMRELHQRSRHAKSASVAELPMSSRGTFVVFSPKGGVGCTTVAANLAIALKNQLKEEVLLMDAKLLFGDLDLMLNLKIQNSISDLVPHVGSLDEGLIRDVVAEHVSGVKVLPAPANAIAAQGIHPEELHRILMALQNIYPVIVIDTGNFLNENAVTVMDASHKILLVLNADIASLRDASRFFDICHTTLGFPRDKILVVLNQHDQREGLSLDDIERSLQAKVFARLPWDPRASLQSINRGVPVFMQTQNTPLRKAFQSMAKNLGSIMEAREGHRPASKKTLPEVLSKSARLG